MSDRVTRIASVCAVAVLVSAMLAVPSVGIAARAPERSKLGKIAALKTYDTRGVTHVVVMTDSSADLTGVEQFSKKRDANVTHKLSKLRAVRLAVPRGASVDSWMRELRSRRGLARISLPYTGTWRIKAYHADAGHVAGYSGFSAKITVR